VPPHNLGEIVAAALHLLDHPECTVDDLMTHVPGPDFPTGGMIVGTAGIRDAYPRGRGRVVMRARVYKESRRNGREQLVLKEILERWRDHRVEVVQRRSRWELGRAQDEAHVLRGLIVAIGSIDEVVRIIRSSRDRDTAARKLQKQLDLDERQSDAILAMRL